MKKWFIIRNILQVIDYIYHKILGYPVPEDEEDKKGDK